MFYFLVTGGLPLRFCSDCGQAYREHHTAGADLLRRLHGGAIPAALHAEEEERFAAALPEASRDAGLALLRALLHIDPAKRPRHAIQISRMLNDIQGVKPERGAFNAADPIHGMRRPTASNGWRHIQGAQ